MSLIHLIHYDKDEFNKIYDTAFVEHVVPMLRFLIDATADNVVTECAWGDDPPSGGIVRYVVAEMIAKQIADLLVLSEHANDDMLPVHLLTSETARWWFLTE